MSAKSILGTLSPLYGAISGEGAMGKLLNPAEAKRIADAENERNAAVAEQMNAERQAAAAAAGGGSGMKAMKKGGKVRSASQRADGIAQRGKTRA
jgi:cytochrome c5